MAEEEVEAAIRRVRAGDPDAYRVVIDAYQNRLRPLVASFCPPGVDAREIAHRTFVDAYRKIDAYRAGAGFFPWLVGIARVLVLLELRRLRVEARRTQGYLQNLVTEAVEPQLQVDGIPDETRVSLLRDCMARLPAPRREIIEMHYTQGQPLAAIAAKIGKSVAAVKFQLFDIRKRLRDCVGRKLAVQRETQA